MRDGDGPPDHEALRRLANDAAPTPPPRLADLGLPLKAQRLLEHIHAEPGCTERDAALALHLRPDTVSRLRNQLLSSGLVLVGQGAKSYHLFPLMPGLDGCWRQVVALRDEPTNQLHTQLVVRDGCRVKDLAEFAWLAWRLDRYAVRRRLQALVDAKLARRKMKPGVAEYVACPIRAAALRVLMPIVRVDSAMGPFSTKGVQA